jgi:3-deoxy-manno-octulosonate cytidylyltransferase (CMP-KDO synthetase)
MTDPALPSGTDRVFAALKIMRKKHASLLRGLKTIINIQGDMPFFDPEPVRLMIKSILKQKNTRMQMWTLAEAWPYAQNPHDLQFVKVVCDNTSHALYFSRYPIPCSRNFDHKALLQHVGVYAYSPQALKFLCSKKPTALEKLEGLEQLRALYHKIPIKILSCSTEAGCDFRGIDCEADLNWALEFEKGEKK